MWSHFLTCLCSVSHEPFSIWYLFIICTFLTLLQWKSNIIFHHKVNGPCFMFSLYRLHEWRHLWLSLQRFHIAWSPSLFLCVWAMGFFSIQQTIQIKNLSLWNYSCTKFYFLYVYTWVWRSTVSSFHFICFSWLETGRCRVYYIKLGKPHQWHNG